MNRNDFDIHAKLITPRIATALIPAFVAGYGLAENAAASFEFLGGPLREQIMPNLRNWAVEYELHRRSKEGILPFESKFVFNSRHNHQHLELKYDGFILTVSQTHFLTDLPRECIFRNEHCLDGQMAISGFDPDVDDDEKNIYAILTHGHASSTPNFLLCGIPSPDMKSWAQCVNLLEYTKGFQIIDPSPATDEIVLDFRRSVEERTESAE